MKTPITLPSLFSLRTPLGTTFRRSLKTLYTPVIDVQNEQRHLLLTHLVTLNSIMSKTQYNRNILYQDKYKKIPQMISSKDTYKLKKLIDNMVMNWEKQEIKNKDKTIESKLSKIGLKMFMDSCTRFKNIDYLVATDLSIQLSQLYMKSTDKKETISEISCVLKSMIEFIEAQKLYIHEDKTKINTLIEKIYPQYQAILQEILVELDYQLDADDIVRVVRGKTFTDKIESNKGWKYSCGLKDDNNRYLSSLGLLDTAQGQTNKKLVSINEECLVLFVDDKVLRDINKILPTLNYIEKLDKPLVIFTSGNVYGDALNAISMHNNKCKRKNMHSKVLIFQYFESSNSNLKIGENMDFINFCRLPKGQQSIYSQVFSEFTPSKITSAQYFGKIDSIKATTAEAFLYNDNHTIENNPFLKTTVTLNVGGTNEFEIDRKRLELDYIINDFLAQSIKAGVVPGYGATLVKAIADIVSGKQGSSVVKNHHNISSYYQIFANHMSNSLQQKFQIDSFSASGRVSQTLFNNDKIQFDHAYIDDNLATVDMSESGIIEPANKLVNTLRAVEGFLNMSCSCDTFVTRIYEIGKKK